MLFDIVPFPLMVNKIIPIFIPNRRVNVAVAVAICMSVRTTFPEHIKDTGTLHRSSARHWGAASERIL